ncbi:hypothetical protein NBRC3257_0250 [Gluconobacter thailandicus NBRC 3257]|uniref:Transposase n=1 Tax=Gluconobacter thailandicus NBRC 3257 TaxID=1381097 RepID=A0ABQ0ISR2_GLUTH|nr:hypothetical protein NBRC3257_0250 [Gluconobacter thailandicus NBRC 3257]
MSAFGQPAQLLGCLIRGRKQQVRLRLMSGVCAYERLAA